MNPQQSPQPQPSPQLQPQPQQIQVSGQAQAGQPPQQFQTAQPASAGKSKLPLILGIGGGLLAIVLLIIGISVWTLLLSPKAQSKKVATSFMSSITTGDIAKAAELSGGAENRDFMEKSAPSVRGSFKMTNNTYTGGVGYYLYGLNGAESRYARVVVKKTSGKYEVSSFVYGNDPLRLIPGSASTSPSPSPAAATTPAPQAAAAVCLKQDDYKWMEYNKVNASSTPYDATYNPPKTLNYTTDVFFKPDSTTEESHVEVYNDWAEFAAKTSAAQWKFRLEGSTYGSDSGTAASKQLASARSERVKAQLVQRGVPADRIIIDPPHNYGSQAQDERSDQIYRRVQLVIDPTCTSASTAR